MNYITLAELFKSDVRSVTWEYCEEQEAYACSVSYRSFVRPSGKFLVTQEEYNNAPESIDDLVRSCEKMENDKTLQCDISSRMVARTMRFWYSAKISCTLYPQQNLFFMGVGVDGRSSSLSAHTNIYLGCVLLVEYNGVNIAVSDRGLTWGVAARGWLEEKFPGSLNKIEISRELGLTVNELNTYLFSDKTVSEDVSLLYLDLT